MAIAPDVDFLLYPPQFKENETPGSLSTYAVRNVSTEFPTSPYSLYG